MNEYASLNYSPEKDKINMHSQYGIMCMVAKKSDSGRWIVDCSDLQPTIFSSMRENLQNELTEYLNYGKSDNNEINEILISLRNKHGI